MPRVVGRIVRPRAYLGVRVVTRRPRRVDRRQNNLSTRQRTLQFGTRRCPGPAPQVTRTRKNEQSSRRNTRNKTLLLLALKHSSSACSAVATARPLQRICTASALDPAHAAPATPDLAIIETGCKYISGSERTQRKQKGSFSPQSAATPQGAQNSRMVGGAPQELVVTSPTSLFR